MSKLGRWLGSWSNVWFIGAFFILALTAIAARRLTIDERALPIPGLAQIPKNLGTWNTVSEQTLEPEVTAALRPDDYILRDYAAPGTGAPIGLFVAYFKSLQNDYGPHSPRICLPGSGWLISSSKMTSIDVPGRMEKIPVNQYTMQKAGSRILVLYWYQNNRHVWADEYNAKLTLLPDLIKYRRSDASLVRVIASLPQELPDAELANCRRFVTLLYPYLVERLATSDCAGAGPCTSSI